MKKSQSGYLLIVALFLLFLMGVIAANMTYLFVGNANSVAKTAQAEQAYYIAESGLNMAIRYWYTKGIACSAITGNDDLTDTPIGRGIFTVTGTSVTTASTTLASAITATATTIPLTNASAFPSSGVVTIGTEGIYYSGISGNSLTGAVRGAGSTAAAAQTSGSTVAQNNCVLTSSGGVPNLTSSNSAKRVVQATMFSFPSTSGGTMNSVTGRGTINFMNGTIYNGHSCLTCSNYPGANIQTNSTSNTFSGFSTQVDANNGDSGSYVQSSYPGSIKADIRQGMSFTTTSLYNIYFKQTRAYVQANADYVGRNIVNRSGVVIYANGNVTINGNGNLGSPTNPVLMYVAGTVNISGAGVWAVIYATGAVTLSNLTYRGALASESSVQLSGVGFYYDYNLLRDMTNNATFSDMLNNVSITGGSSATPNPVPANIEEIYN